MHCSSTMNLRGPKLLGHHRSRSPQLTPRSGWRSNQRSNQVIQPPAYNVFINHRRIDTKRTVASLLYHHLTWLNLHPFLDFKSMQPGDKLFEKINGAIRGCKIGVAVFSPRYCESYFCLHELALMMESRKKIIPIFCDIKPSELCVVDNGIHPLSQIRRFEWALEEAKYTVGLTFNSFKGNWSNVLTSTSDIVIKRLMEIEEEEQMQRGTTPISFRCTTSCGRINKK